ncbi:MAG: hypothetical protein DRI71_10210 [Bacteroidetes bacterium]|nr:MAG: hypothetical protein DRI71_10210 [Bacteroidota bacterium]
MSDEEFEVIDHLYFVTSYEDLKDLSNMGNAELLEVLISLITKGWVKCFSGPDNEIRIAEVDLQMNYYKYEYLATKQGLLAHNMR